ncbi:MFS transporter [Allokutzneria albata]|uniref:Predicted arabinose efflux permease, MFS family n=1 Tax=Allokutzneria albata TaxID=211114 RepID=A0A1G9RVM6_ALLAB|nr:MFS transporter [Allokutzneria albata]SDM26555.1 Predicted arabinose efflux permease, MFS family [Allokutzneria albata]
MAQETARTDVPARMDRLPWAKWHWTVVLGLGTVWILDGLEVTIVGALGERLTDPESGLRLTEAEVGIAASFYVLGAVLGSLFFGYLTDRLGRKRLFLLTLALYLVATVLTAFSFSAWWFFLMRFLTGAGVGGEYAAINSAIDELVPARVRGRVDLIVNGSYWLGAAVGAALTLVLLDPRLFALDIGWRVAFALGAVLGVGILLVRRNVPESPRWLFTHGRADEADKLVGEIERKVEEQTGATLEPVSERIEVKQRGTVGFGTVGKVLLKTYPKRTLLGLGLFVGQAFLYNAVYFTQALVLGRFFGISGATVGGYLVPLAVGSLVGPLVLGKLFDTIGRRTMISVCYLGSGVLLVGTGLLFQHGLLTETTLTIAWTAVFFLASAGASAAYLTVSEIFPLEIRAMAIALFYSVGTGLGGIIGPALFGVLVETGDPAAVAIGYYIGAGVMMLGGIVEIVLGVEAAQRSLEDVASPLSASADEKPRVSSKDATRSGYAPLPGTSDYPSAGPDDQREVDAILTALRREPLTKAELRARLGAAQWGPGRFTAALRRAVADGDVRELGRGRYCSR